VLVVEDEYLIADDIAGVLSAGGAEVIGPVGTEEKALQLVASETLDLAVLDLNLHGAMAYTVADALRQKGVPFVFSTGYDRSVIPEAYADVPRWEKPFYYHELAWALPRLVTPPP
jgi:CheY-like chemotaxis protein